MEKLPCSIFNDVIGPVMRGPSSSHVAGGARIAELVRQSFPAPLKKVTCDFDPTGALAASHTGHGTDMGFTCGLLGIDLSYPGVDQYEKLAKENDLEIEYRILKYGAVHPGNYRIHAEDQTGTVHDWEGISVGGGMVEMQKFDGFSVCICGDFYELLFILDLKTKSLPAWKEFLAACLPASEFCLEDCREETALINWKLGTPADTSVLDMLKNTEGILTVAVLEPILPTHSRAHYEVPFSTATGLLEYAGEHPMEPWEYAVLYEAARGGSTREEVLKNMDHILSIMEDAVENGLKGTSYENRILGPQAHLMENPAKKLVPCTPLNTVIKYITAVMETKSSMGLIVAAPTIGSCGCLPGTVLGLAEELKLDREEVIKGLMVAGLIGVFFAEEATFSAEVGGCQVECGAASGMAAAAVAQMMGGSIADCLNAASVALQNITGLACDPVGNRVEVPCLGKNIMGGSNAISSANIILAGYDAVVPLDETIAAIYEIGKSLPLELRCTFGGLGKTPASLEILKKLSSPAR